MNSSLENEVLSAMRRLIRATDLDSKRLARQTNLSTSQLLVLETLYPTSGNPIGQIARDVGLAQATVTSMIDRLEARGLVERTRSESDRRQVIVSLTVSGRETVDRAPTALQTRFLANFSALKPWEQSAILASLQRLAELMEAGDLDASPVLDVGSID